MKLKTTTASIIIYSRIAMSFYILTWHYNTNRKIKLHVFAGNMKIFPSTLFIKKQDSCSFTNNKSITDCFTEMWKRSFGPLDGKILALFLRTQSGSWHPLCHDPCGVRKLREPVRIVSITTAINQLDSIDLYSIGERKRNACSQDRVIWIPFHQFLG